MSTRSRIAIEDRTGKVRSIYCHWDGYPKHHGPILLEHYSTREKVEELIKLGSISSLSTKVNIKEGVIHNFENQTDDTVVAYHRDNGDDLFIRTDDSLARFIKSDVEMYGYIFSVEGEWLLINGSSDIHKRTADKLLEQIF